METRPRRLWEGSRFLWARTIQGSALRRWRSWDRSFYAGSPFCPWPCPLQTLALAECAGGPGVSSAEPRMLCEGCEDTWWDHKGEMELATPCLAWPETPSRLLGWICWALLGRKGAALDPETWPRVPAPPLNNGGRGQVTWPHCTLVSLRKDGVADSSYLLGSIRRK